MKKFKMDRDSLLLLLNDVGIETMGETNTDFICLCPIHLNKDTPALNISKEYPYAWRCWSPRCGKAGILVQLVSQVKDITMIEALRFIYKFRTAPIDMLVEINKNIEQMEYEIWPESILDSTRRSYDDGIFTYMYDRGYTKETLEKFEIGFSNKQQRITIPVRDENGMFVGFSGRAIHEWQTKKYWDKGLPKRQILFNLNNAKIYNQGIIVEGPLDAMRVYQAGFSNVVAIMGGGFTAQQSMKLLRFFKSVIIFTDQDEAGRKFLRKIEGVMLKAGRIVEIVWAFNNKKDPGEMTESEIKNAINSRYSIVEYEILNKTGDKHEESIRGSR